jgi:hypothetical protein
MALHHLFKRNGLGAPCPDVFQSLFGKVNIFQVVKVLKDCLTDIETLGPPVAFAKASRRSSISAGSRTASMLSPLRLMIAIQV